jgi:hypothetical protein
MTISYPRLSVIALLFLTVRLVAQPGNLIWGTRLGGGLNSGSILNYAIGSNVVTNEFDYYRTYIGYLPSGGALTAGTRFHDLRYYRCRNFSGKGKYL